MGTSSVTDLVPQGEVRFEKPWLHEVKRSEKYENGGPQLAAQGGASVKIGGSVRHYQLA